jgi:hypothetical protein
MFRNSQLIASSHKNLSFKNDRHTIVVKFINNFDIASLLIQFNSNKFHSRNNLSLHFENIQGNDSSPVIDVYLNLEQENISKIKNYVGTMSLFGLEESSMNSKDHKGKGQHRIFNIEEVFRKVYHQKNWSDKQFILTLISYKSLPADAKLTIGLVTLYLNQW